MMHWLRPITAVLIVPVASLLVAACSSSSSTAPPAGGETDAAAGGSPGATGGSGNPGTGGRSTGGGSTGTGGASTGGAGPDGGGDEEGEADGGTTNDAGTHAQMPIVPLAVMAAEYTIVEVKGPLGQTQTRAINNSGLVLGQYGDDDKSVLFTWTEGGGLVNVSPANVYSTPSRLNSSGVYVANEEEVLNWTSLGASNLTGSYALLPTPAGHDHLSANGINDSNVIVGGTTDASGRGFRLTNGTFELLNTLGGDWSSASAINAKGLVAGGAELANGDSHAATFVGKTPTDLGTLGGATSSATDLNDSGVVVGDSKLANGDTHAFVFDGTMHDLGVVDGNYSRATAVNAGSLVVGASTTTSGTAAFVWTSAEGLIELSTRIGAVTGWSLHAAIDVNDVGQIVGYGLHDGASVGFVMTPKP